MKNLGRAILLLLLAYQSLLAVNAKISPSTIYEGDQASLILSAQGGDVKFPDLKDIAGYSVISQSTATNISNINGNISRTISREYLFIAQKDFTVESMEINVDGNKERTKPISVKVKKQKVGKQEAFTFELKANKTEAYIGESVRVDFIFKKHLDIELAEANFNSPSFANFWAKPTEKVPAVIDGDYMVYTVRYLLFPQKSGDLKIEAGRMDAGILQTTKQGFFQSRRVKWKSLYTKGLNIKVNPLPAGVDLYGNFKFDISVDKTQVKANEPVNLTVVIKGIGNVDDIDDFKIDIKDAIVYADKPTKKIYTNDNNELGEFVQKFAIVSDRNFTIEPLEFSFLDSNDKEIKHLKSKAFQIEVKGSLIKTETAQLQKKKPIHETGKIKTEIVYDKASKTQLILFTLGGFGLGFLTAFLLGKNFRTEKREKMDLPLSLKIKKSKSDKELLSLLLPSADKSDKMRELIKQLEENIYENKKHQIDKKELTKNIEIYLKKEEKVNEILK